MVIYHTTYTDIYKKEMKHYKNDLEFQCEYQGFKIFFWFK